ncbi:HAD family hydrolase [Shinella sp. BYT-45]|uniref:HAD family hydrolase n=1 Tax=Shinella sp. BYT-45 TaxID=3377377 RepID=UPI00397E9F38
MIFDIDGTLVDTAGLHNRLIGDVLARDGLDLAFKPAAAYAHYTDYCVLDDLYRHNHGRPVSASDLSRYDALYAEALEAWLPGNPLREIAGARTLLKDLAARDDVIVAFATGSLRAMARIKLAFLEVDADRAVLATGSEHLTREAIVHDAAMQAEARFGEACRVVILGDGPWDQRTAQNLALAFVAIESGTHRFGKGPVAVQSDYIGFGAETLIGHASPIDGFRRRAAALRNPNRHIETEDSLPGRFP